MRLLQLSESGELSLTKDKVDDIPQYAILSHTWGNDDDEVTFEDLEKRLGKSKVGYTKLEFCGNQAKKNGIDYFWIDTCCIKKSSDAELSEAINSMFRWYQRAEICYVYLSDVSMSRDATNPRSLETTWHKEFRGSTWFRRGWTLQELIAPASVEFFSREGEFLGDKESLGKVIQEITGIPIEALRGGPLMGFTVEERLAWAKDRKTTRQEDEAYSLLGIFNIDMTVRYGAGKEKAFERLLRKISKSSTTQLNTVGSYQAWQVLRLLKTVDYYQTMQAVPRRSHGTCEWFTQQSYYKDWLTSQEPCLLCYFADPGCGKSVLSRYLIEEVFTESSYSLVYYIFPPGCQAVASIATALCAVLHQFCLGHPHLMHTVATALDQNGEQLLHEPWSLWELFQQIVHASGVDKLICIFDGLDQCDGSEVRLLGDLISNFGLQFPVSRIKFILTSCPYYYIKQTLHEIERHLAVLCADSSTESENISRDIDYFIESQVLKLGADLALSEKECAQLQWKLTQHRNDSFLWVYLVTEELRRNPPDTSTELQINKLPQTVVAAYEDILSRCPNRQAARKILAIILVARRPICLDDMRSVRADGELRPGQAPGPSRLDRVSETLKHLSGLFLRIIGTRIYLFHQTARDFLLCEQVNGQLATTRAGQYKPWSKSLSLATCHFIIAVHCFRSIQAKKPANGDKGSQQLLMDTPFLAYAEQNWAYHASATLQHLRVYHQSTCIQRFLGYGLDMQMLDLDGKSLLHRVVDVHSMAVDISLAQHVLKHGGLVTSADCENMTCMQYAVLRAHKPLIDVLLKAGFAINTAVIRRGRYARLETLQQSQPSASNTSIIQQGLNSLHAAVFFGRPTIIERLFEGGVNVNAVDEDGHSALHLALCQSLLRRRKDDLWEDGIYMLGYIEDYEEEAVEEVIADASRSRISIVKVLCDHPEINISPKDNLGRTPLHVVRYGMKEYGANAAQMLMCRGADPLAPDKHGKIPIHCAARAGDVKALEILALKPKHLMIRDQNGRNALHFVAESECEDAVRWVLQKAGPLNIAESIDMEGHNALHHALYNGSPNFGHITWNMVHLLLEMGICAKQTDHDGRDVLAHYIINGSFNVDLRIVALLLVYGANSVYEDAAGRTLAHHMVCIEDEICVTAWQLIQTWGLRSESLDKDGRNILHHAALHGSITAKFLSNIERSVGLNPSQQDVQGLTPYDHAFKESRQIHDPNMFRMDRWDHAVAVLRPRSRG
jgi:ankyrin repeat protein